jgi:hypothetical protein
VSLFIFFILFVVDASITSWILINLLHCKKRFAVFPSPAGMPLTRLSLAGNNLILPAQGEFDK